MLKLKDEKEVYYAPKHHRLALIKYFHEHPMKNHPGAETVMNDIKQTFYWPKNGPRHSTLH
jgi:hypothetical protein